MKTNEMRINSCEQKAASFCLPNCCFAATCGSCYWNDGGWCSRHGGWVDFDKWSCSSYS